MRLSKPGLRQHSKRNVIAWPKDMCQSCGTLLLWRSTLFARHKGG
ncbi:hypothetical protein Gohar_010344 [Gossypium harknessii]|uniref:Uncharacterized protein n=1 Tax=Gossypium harknessii TaxID=34285 RepID=A0A7J9GSV2_9ROSI|nr:hypothetical protein [Gossypium harknessii]